MQMKTTHASIGTHHAHFDSLCSRLEENYSNLSAAHENFASQTRTDHQTQIDHLNASVVDCVDQTARSYATLEARIKDTNAVYAEITQQVSRPVSQFTLSPQPH